MDHHVVVDIAWRLPTEPQGNVTVPSHNPPENRTFLWDATNTFNPGEAD
jgi:hypothetical protein